MFVGQYTENGSIIRLSDGAIIPHDESNRDYREIISNGGNIAPFTPPPETLPHLEPDQFWFVVRVSGHEDDLTAWLDTLREDDPVAWAAASSKLQFAKFFERDHPFVESAREALGIPSEQLDALWAYGANS